MMLGLREEQKRRTRARILAVARNLFENPGYDQTTIRMIAAEAGVAIGSVFTTFESKEDVLLAITGEMFDEVARDLTRTFSVAGGSARERTKLLFSQAFIALESRLPLLMVHLGLSWRWSGSVEADRQSHMATVFAILVEAISDGVRTGELPRDTDIPLLTEILTDVFVRNFRRAWFRQLDAPAVTALVSRQIDLIFDGARGPGPG